MTIAQIQNGPLAAAAVPNLFECVNLDSVRRAILVLAALLAPVCRIVWLGNKPINTSGADIVLPLGVLFLAWRLLGSGIRLPKLGLCCAALLVMAASGWVNAELAIAGRGSMVIYVEFFKVLLLWLYFYLVINVVEDKGDLILFLRCWIFSSVVVALLGIGGSVIFQLTGMHNPFSLHYRAQGAFEDSNLFAAHLVLSFFFAWTLQRLVGRWSYWIAAAMVTHVAGVFFSASRGGMLALAASLVLIWALWSSWRAKVIVAFGAVLAGAVISPLLSTSMLESNPITARLVTTTVDLDNPEAQQRRNLWKIAIAEWTSSPVLGVGKGNYGTRSNTESGTYAHSTYLGLLAELGIAGFIVYGLLFGIPTVQLLMSGIGSNPGISLLLLVGLASILLAGVTINIENYRGLWMTVALVECYRRIVPPAGSGQELSHVS